MKATDEYGFCNKCGGHGSVSRRVPVPPGNLPSGRLARGLAVADGVVWHSEPCDWCNGRDVVTPLMEARAES